MTYTNLDKAIKAFTEESKEDRIDSAVLNALYKAGLPKGTQMTIKTIVNGKEKHELH